MNCSILFRADVINSLCFTESKAADMSRFAITYSVFGFLFSYSSNISVIWMTFSNVDFPLEEPAYSASIWKNSGQALSIQTCIVFSISFIKMLVIPIGLISLIFVTTDMLFLFESDAYRTTWASIGIISNTCRT